MHCWTMNFLLWKSATLPSLLYSKAYAPHSQPSTINPQVWGKQGQGAIHLRLQGYLAHKKQRPPMTLQ